MEHIPGESGKPFPVRPALSEDVISPEIPPDPKDGFRLLVDGATEYAVFALSPTGLVATWNRGAERIKGYRPEEIIGKHFSVFYPAADREAGVPERILETALTEGRVATEGWRVRRDGTRFWASVIVTALLDDAGRLRGFGKLTRDETERREIHAEAVRRAEQERIAISLADSVVRRLFSMSLHADSAINLTGSPDARRQLQLLVEEADDAIRFLRSAIFEVGSSSPISPPPISPSPISPSPISPSGGGDDHERQGGR